MRVLLTSAGLETEEIEQYFVKMIGKDMSEVKALFIPTAATIQKSCRTLRSIRFHTADIC